jgi:hypothetical protein
MTAHIMVGRLPPRGRVRIPAKIGLSGKSALDPEPGFKRYRAQRRDSRPCLLGGGEAEGLNSARDGQKPLPILTNNTVACRVDYFRMP